MNKSKEKVFVYIVSLGGATEGSIWSIYYDVDKVDERWSSIPYGYPLDNQSIYVLDECKQPKPTNVPGEIYIGGDGIALGYWNDKEKTKNAFINTDVPVYGSKPIHLYRTGDWGVRRENGYVDFLGREDSQVKVRGYRIELGEIESAIQQHEAVSGAVSKVVGHGRDAYIVVFVKTELDASECDKIKRYAETLLPHYMLPKKWEFLKNFPLGGTGKVDRKALQINENSLLLSGGESPISETEIALASMWKEVLSLHSRPSRSDSFFDLGGSSFMAVQLVFKISEQFNVTVRITDIFISVPLFGSTARLIEQQEYP